MEKGLNNIVGHLTDIKDMVIDQNEWYEEMFYEGREDSDPSSISYGGDTPSVKKRSMKKKKWDKTRQDIEEFNNVAKTRLFELEGISKRRDKVR